MNDTLTSYSIINDTLSFVSSVMITTISIIGNTAVILILSKQEFRKEPLFRYLITATIFDTVNAIMIWPTNYLDIFMINQIDGSCKVYKFSINMLATFSSYMNNFTSLDTLMIVKYPTKFKFRKTYKYQIFIQLMIFLDRPFFWINIKTVMIIEKLNLLDFSITIKNSVKKIWKIGFTFYTFDIFLHFLSSQCLTSG